MYPWGSWHARRVFRQRHCLSGVAFTCFQKCEDYESNGRFFSLLQLFLIFFTECVDAAARATWFICREGNSFSFRVGAHGFDISLSHDSSSYKKKPMIWSFELYLTIVGCCAVFSENSYKVVRFASFRHYRSFIKCVHVSRFHPFKVIWSLKFHHSLFRQAFINEAKIH